MTTTRRRAIRKAAVALALASAALVPTASPAAAANGEVFLNNYSVCSEFLQHRLSPAGEVYPETAYAAQGIYYEFWAYNRTRNLWYKFYNNDGTFGLYDRVYAYPDLSVDNWIGATDGVNHILTGSSGSQRSDSWTIVLKLWRLRGTGALQYWTSPIQYNVSTYIQRTWTNGERSGSTTCYA